jgi:hypothetical protein
VGDTESIHSSVSATRTPGGGVSDTAARATGGGDGDGDGDGVWYTGGGGGGSRICTPRVILGGAVNFLGIPVVMV